MTFEMNVLLFDKSQSHTNMYPHITVCLAVLSGAWAGRGLASVQDVMYCILIFFFLFFSSQTSMRPS